MFQKILIANRGEIVLRVLRACKEMGIQTVVVYSEADEQSLPVLMADEAICIGPAPSSQSYLRPDRIISAAEITDVDAIHPGFGFLSENEAFAEQCHSCNITFIGPSHTTIAQMGDKAVAKSIARRAGVPIVPGSDGPVPDEETAVQVAKQIGFPVIIKAVAGGGGKGMRLAHNAGALVKEFQTARVEAEKAFGDGSVYIEKYIEEPRHIEFQIAADAQGNVVHLGERDCSVQRRYQKLIEEGPSPFVTPQLREKMGQAAVAIAKACAYRNVGTVEFLVDKHGAFYFIEMNTRIQVEHGVTEAITGIDLVKLQIQIAMGQPLPFKQEDIVIRGHAIECRINAENPERNFAPCPGKIDICIPPGGPGVRVDSHIYSGYTVPPYYDSMLAKVIGWGHTRDEAIRTLRRALQEYVIQGIPTTASFGADILQDPQFVQGDVTTQFIELFMSRR
jgi:acetyl-CoA carboxylase biotin carboxylase subunit